MNQEDERQQREDAIKKAKEEENNERLSTAWQRHEQDVSETIQEIAKKYGIIRCEKGDYPYPGTPDNVLLIGDLYTIFDAKSPKNPEDLKNFPNYLKAQAEGMKKYCQKEKVRNIAFFVVPSSTIESLDTFMYQLASYTVYIITPEALLPILQMLKYLEAYDFTDQLSPEDRDKLCCFIGKLTYTTKRKIQIDNYFSKELITSLKTIDTLPNYIGENIDKYERTEKLNPPMDKRQKIVQIKDIASDIKKVENEILSWSVLDAKTDDPDINSPLPKEEAEYTQTAEDTRGRGS